MSRARRNPEGSPRVSWRRWVLRPLLLQLCLPAPSLPRPKANPTRAVPTGRSQPNTSREIAIAFLHGYLLGKSGNSKFDVDVLENQTNTFIEQCLDNPQSKAVDVMMKLKG